MGPLFQYFRYCANEGIRIGIEKNITSKYNLHYQLYHNLRSESTFYCRYVYGALECAASKLKLYKKTRSRNPLAKKPRISRNHLILDNGSYKIDGDIIRIPTERGKYVFVKLTPYVIKAIGNAKRGNLVITENKLILSYSRIVPDSKVTDFTGIDLNLNNVTTYDTNNTCLVYDLSDATRVASTYATIRSKFRRNDSRIKKRIFQKHGKAQRNKVNNILHCVSKNITSRNHGIVMEDLKGIRRMYKRGNFQSRRFRRRMNSWPFYELRRQIEYKARWLGLPLTHVCPRGTSAKCATCGSKLVPEEHRMMFCSFCKISVDRDANAARNILLRGTQVVPDGAAGEAMVTEPGRRQPVICRVDAVKSSRSVDHTKA